MKKFIAWLLLVTMLLGAFAGCSNTEQNPSQAEAAGDVEGITAAIDYLKAFYKDGGTETFADFERWGIVRIAGVPYEVVWTADVSEDLVKAVDNGDGTVTIDINESCEESTPYVLTATVTDDAGNTVSHTWNYILPVGLGEDYGALVDMAYALEKDQALDFNGTLVGTVTAINTAWSDEYKNITVTIIVKGREDKPIKCYRLKGDGAQELAVGDLITVTGILKNYNGEIEFDAGCMLDKVEKGAGDLGDIPSDPAEILAAAYALEVGAALPYTATLTGEISAINTPYSADYKNITVTIKVEGCEDKPIMCYRMKGNGADTLMPGDIITVSGTIKNYNGTIEFDTGCQLVSAAKGENSIEIPTDPQEILEAAFALKPGESLPYTATLTGKIVGINSKYSEKYGNISVTIQTGEPWYYVECYRLKGDGVDKIWLDDIITVTGNIVNYNGTIEFNAGSVLESWVDKPRPTAPTDPAEIVKQAFELGEGDSLPYYCYLTGTVTDAGYGWDGMSDYVTVDIEVAGKTIECYKLKGEDIKDIEKGDVITVWGMIKNYKGKIEFNGCKLITPSDKELVDNLYDLEAGESIDNASLTGVITSIDTPYSSQYKNITVTMIVDGKKDQPVQCYRMKGQGVELLEVGDTIQVSGKLTHYVGKSGKSSYQFDAGSLLVAWTNANIPAVDSHSSQEDVLAAAALLGTGQRLVGVCLSGNITKVNTAYNERYKNITVTINANGQSVRCNRLGDKNEVQEIGVGDYIKVYGKLWKTSDGSLEFQNNCGLVSYTLADDSDSSIPATLKEQLEDAAAKGTYTGYDSTAQGPIVTEPQYQERYKNYTFTVRDEATGLEIYCYGLGGNGYTPKMGDVIKIVGQLTAYKGTPQFDYKSKLTVISQVSGGDDSGDDDSGSGEIVIPATLAEQLAEAAKLTSGTLPYKSTITGTITNNPTESSRTPGSYRFKVSDGTNTVECYYVPVNGGTPANGASVTVTGYLSAYNGNAQFFESNATATLHGGSAACEHTKTTTTSTATCTEAGVETVTCECGEVISTTDVAALGHEWVDGVCERCEEECKHNAVEQTVTKEPTCGETGLLDAVCADCGHVMEKDVEIGVTGEHTYVDGICSGCGATEPTTEPETIEPEAAEPEVAEPEVTE